jgi:hypothetical protein
MSLKLGDTTQTVSGDSLQDVALQFRQIVKEALADPGELTADGRFTSFVTPGDLESSKPGRKAGFCCIDPLRFICCFGSHRPGEHPATVLEIEIPGAFKPSQHDRDELIKAAHEQRTQNAEEAAQRAQAVWSQCELDLRQHPYLAARGVLDVTRSLAGQCVRLFPKNLALVVPMLDSAGKLWNRQAIAQDGRKKFLEGGRLEGLGVWIPGPPASGQKWYVAEGFAKAVAVYAATGLPVLVAFTAGNLAAAIQEHCSAILPGGTVAGDGDSAGRIAADGALQRFPQLKVVYPPDGADDWSDLLIKSGLDALKAALAEVEPSTQEPPAPLRREPPDPEPFPLDALGDVLSPAVDALSRIIQAPPAMIAQSLLAAAAFCVQPYGNVIIDGRVMPLSIYCISIGASGERKSAVDTQALKPIFDKQRELVEAYKVDTRLHKVDLRDFEKVEKDLNKDKVVDLAAIRKNRDEKIAAMASVGDEPEPPLFPNLLISEPTAEGMFKLFEKGQPALGLFSDEGGLLIGGHAMQKETRLRTIATLSKVWDGRPLDRVRAGDGASVLYDRRLSLHLMMQPLVASELFTDPIYTDQGFLSRVLCAWPVSTAGNRRYVTEDPTADPAIRNYWNRLTALLNTPPQLREGTRNELQPRCIPLSHSAKQVWIQYADTIEGHLAEGQALETVRGIASKAAEHVARIAGVLTLVADMNALEIGVREVESAIQLMEYYLTEVLRLQSAGISDPELSLAAKCLRWLQTSETTQVYPSLIYQYGPPAIRDSDTAKQVIKILEQHRWLVRVQGGGMADGMMRRELWNCTEEARP